MANNIYRRRTVYVAVRSSLIGAVVIAISWITWKYPASVFNSASIAALIQALLVISISVPMAFHAYHDPYHGRTFRNAIAVLVGMCGVVGPVAFFIAQTEAGLNAGVFSASFWISAVTGISWFIGFWTYVIAKIIDTFGQANAHGNAS